jgi:hypothetical protein
MTPTNDNSGLTPHDAMAASKLIDRLLKRHFGLVEDLGSVDFEEAVMEEYGMVGKKAAWLTKDEAMAMLVAIEESIDYMSEDEAALPEHKALHAAKLEIEGVLEEFGHAPEEDE